MPEKEVIEAAWWLPGYMAVEADTASKTVYISEAGYRNQRVWVQGERECPHLRIAPACEAEPDHIICWDCYGVVTPVLPSR